MRVPVSELVDLERLGPGNRAPTLPEIRAALPRGWVLEDDGVTARRDARLFFREGWILIAGLVIFGAAGIALFYTTFPSGWRGVARFAAMLGILLVAGGVVAPRITRALARRRP
jgi:hypothetical protein